MLNKILKLISFGLMGVLPIVLALITIIEKIQGRETAVVYYYHAWWFIGLWGVVSVCALFYLIKQRRFKQWDAFLIHLSFVIILIGALVTFLFGERGYVHLRVGESSKSYIGDGGMSQKMLPFQMKLASFKIKYHDGSHQPEDFISTLVVNNKEQVISMNHIFVKDHYRFYQMSYDLDKQGAILLVSRDPWGIGVTYLGYALLAFSLLWLLWRKMGWKGFLSISIPTIVVWSIISGISPMTPVLRTPMLALHVSVILISYVLLLLIALFGMVGILSSSKSIKMYAWSNYILYPALTLLTLGVFIGAVWANVSWGQYWSWDSKETWALITMLVYALPLHKESLKFFAEPKKFHVYCSISFLVVLMTFFGVSFLLGGMHSYM